MSLLLYYVPHVALIDHETGKLTRSSYIITFVFHNTCNAKTPVGGKKHLCCTFSTLLISFSCRVQPHFLLNFSTIFLLLPAIKRWQLQIC